MKLKKIHATIFCGFLMSIAISACNGGNSSATTNTQQQVLTPMVVHTTTSLKALNATTATVALNLYAIAKGNGVYVAVGDGGTVLISTDGNVWNAINSGISVDIHDVVFNKANKLFYAVGDNSTVMSSPDGITWTQYKALTPVNDLYSAMYVNGHLVIGASNSTIYEIDMGGRQSVLVRNTVDNMKLVSTANSNDLMLLGSDDGSILYKPANNWASDWNRATKFSGMSINGLAFESTDKFFIAGSSTGKVMQSGNGTVWSYPVTASSSGINSVILDDKSNYFYAVGGSGGKSMMVSSRDYNSWSPDALLPIGTAQLNDIKCFESNDCFVVGDSATILLSVQRSNTKQPYWLLASGTYATTPTVAMVYPANHATNVSKTSPIKISFSESVNNVSLSNVSLHIDSPTGSTVTITSIAPESNNSYTLKPSSSLNGNSRYYVVIGSGITDLTGNAVVPTRFSFTTVSNLALSAMPESSISWSNTLQYIPLGSFGLYGFTVTNYTGSQLKAVNLADLLPSDEFSFDEKRSSCLLTSVDNVSSMTLSPNSSCALVIRYTPVTPADGGVVKFAMRMSNTSSSEEKSNEIKIPYSSRP